MTEQRNLFLAIILSIAILVGFQLFYELPRLQSQYGAEGGGQPAETTPDAPATEPPPAALGSGAPAPGTAAPDDGAGPRLPDAPALPGAPPRPTAAAPAPSGRAIGDGLRAQVIAREIAAGTRVRIETPRLFGSLSLVGARLDDLSLSDYRVSPDPTSDEIVLLTPTGSRRPYYTETGWVPQDPDVAVPTRTTPWTVAGGAATLTPDQPLVLTWDNGAGLVFECTIAVDEDYLFTVTQRVRNRTDQSVELFPYGLVVRHGIPELQGYYIMHEGPIGVFDGTLTELDYDDVKEEGVSEHAAIGGWIGITDKYWLVSLIPDQQQSTAARFVHTLAGAEDRFQVDTLGPKQTIDPGSEIAITGRIFAGAKEVLLLDHYSEEFGIANFDLAVDFGWFYFLTKPFFYALYYINYVVGNFGVAIILFTILVKLLFYPLADKSYKAMSKMKKIQPEVMRLRERFASDKARMNQEMMALYKREKANPVSGCLPILIQIPVFFALYKVLFVTIEMRHAPFFGWIQDLSAPDPTTIFNLFGLIPWTPPDMLMIGIWPLIMGGTMWLQQKLNPPPPDPTQARIFQFLPIFFTFLLARFPAGLVIYWTWNNGLSILQQYTIMRRMGVPVGNAPPSAGS